MKRRGRDAEETIGHKAKGADENGVQMASTVGKDRLEKQRTREEGRGS